MDSLKESTSAFLTYTIQTKNSNSSRRCASIELGIHAAAPDAWRNGFRVRIFDAPRNNDLSSSSIAHDASSA